MEAFRNDVPVDVVESRFEEAVRSVSFLGFHHLENMGFLLRISGAAPEKLRALLSRYQIDLIGLYHMYTGNDPQAYLEQGEQLCRFLRLFGADRLIVQPKFWNKEPYYRPTDTQQLIFIWICSEKWRKFPPNTVSRPVSIPTVRPACLQKNR